MPKKFPRDSRRLPITVRVERDLKFTLAAIAQIEHRDLSSAANYALDQFVKHWLKNTPEEAARVARLVAEMNEQLDEHERNRRVGS